MTRTEFNYQKTNTMKTKIQLLFVLLVCGLQFSAQSDGEIRGLIQNTDFEPVPFATIKVLQGNTLIGGTTTDIDGKYSVKPLSPGNYELIIMHAEYATQTIRKINVTPSSATYVDWKMQSNDLGVVDVVAKEIDYTKTGVDINVFHTLSMGIEELTQNASYVKGDIKNAISFMTSEVVSSGDGDIHIRGSRNGSTGYFIDGVRVMEANYMPGLSIENISAFTGGVPAMYGDLTSGAIMITTKTYFSGMRDKNIRQASAQEASRIAAAKRKEKEEEAKRKAEIEKEGVKK